MARKIRRARNIGPATCRRVSPWRAPVIVLAVVVVVLGGCSRGSGGPAGGVNLQGTCQFRACVCAPDDSPAWINGKDEPVVWGSEGTPSCPVGHSLKRGKLKS